MTYQRRQGRREQSRNEAIQRRLCCPSAQHCAVTDLTDQHRGHKRRMRNDSVREAASATQCPVQHVRRRVIRCAHTTQTYYSIIDGATTLTKRRTGDTSAIRVVDQRVQLVANAERRVASQSANVQCIASIHLCNCLVSHIVISVAVNR